MLDQFLSIASALWDHDFSLLTAPNVRLFVYTLLIITLILENGLLPAAFLPGDSFLLLTGIIVARSEMSLPLTITLLTTASFIGYWLGFLQGRWLSHTKFVQKWIANIPKQHYLKTQNLLLRFDVIAFVIARFTAFVRTIMPILLGLSEISHKRFYILNFLSSLLWVSILVLLGYVFGHSSFFMHYQSQIMMVLTLIPITLIIIGLLSFILMLLRNKKIKQIK